MTNPVPQQPTCINCSSPSVDFICGPCVAALRETAATLQAGITVVYGDGRTVTYAEPTPTGERS